MGDFWIFLGICGVCFAGYMAGTLLRMQDEGKFKNMNNGNINKN